MTGAVDGDHIAMFAATYRLDEAELREVISWGPRETREFLEANGILDDFPRRAPAAARREATR